MARSRPPFLGEANDIRAWLSGVAVSISDPLLLKAMWMLDRWTGTGTDYDDEDAHLMDLLHFMASERALILEQRRG